MGKRETFSTLHPMIGMIYFVYVLVISMLFMHPAVLAISLLSSGIYAVYLKGIRAVKLQFFAVLPLMIVTAIINPLFNHEGVTVLFFLNNGDPITLEAVCYGIAAAAMFGSVIMWFSCYNQIMTSDKFIYLFGRIIPALSLLVSMALRFVPRFTNQIKETANAQRAIGRGTSEGNVLKRAVCGMRILSITVTWALENAVVTADSMKSRGYGQRGRTSFSVYRFDKRDCIIFMLLAMMAALFILCAAMGFVQVSFYPSIRINAPSVMSFVGLGAFALFCNMPILLNIAEDIKWRSLQSKI